MTIRKIRWALSVFAILVLAAACETNPASPTEPPAPPTPTSLPEDDAYPPPGQGSVKTVQPAPNPYPGPGESSTAVQFPALPANSGNVFVDEHSLMMSESLPVKAKLLLSGNLPTPCHEFHSDVLPPDEENRIQVRVYSLASPDKVCIQVLEPFEAEIPLGEYTEGAFTVWVNGEKYEAFELP